jgi:hypothetical protein
MRYNTTSNVLEFVTRYASTYYTNNLVLDRGNVGIGNSSPSSLLNVGTSSNTEITIGDASANAQGRLRFLTSNNQKNFQIGFNYNVGGGLEFTRSTAIGGTAFTTPDMVITNDGNVGIGTASPASSYGFSKTLEIQGAVNAEINISQFNNSKDWSLGIVNGANYQQTTSGQDYVWLIGGSEKMRITSAGELIQGNNTNGITPGTSLLRLANTGIYGGGQTGPYGTYGAMIFNATTNYTGGAKRYMITNGYQGTSLAFIRSADASTDPAISGDGGTVSSGSVSYYIASTGYNIFPEYVGMGTTAPTSQLFVNNTADGDKIRWGRSDALVGSVGTFNGVPYIGYQGGVGGGIMFNGSSIEPTALGSTRSSSTNDIGSNSYKWRNIYLSGGAYLGGTASGNLLDHYEEGTWIPVIAHNNGTGAIPLTVNSARYIRVGELVYLSCYISQINPNGNAGGSGAYYGIRGFPFTPENYGVWQIAYANTPVTAYGGYSSTASFYFMSNGTNGQRSQGHINGAGVNAWGTNATLMMNCVYNIHGN